MTDPLSLPDFIESCGLKSEDVAYTHKIILEYLLHSKHLKLAKRLLQSKEDSLEIPFSPTRMIMQDYTAVPAFVDLASIRDQVVAQGGDPQSISPVVPVDVVIDHSILIDSAGASDSHETNQKNEIERNHERYRFLKWCQYAFSNVNIVPPGNGIVHQLNMERFAQFIHVGPGSSLRLDSVLGTDSHTTMINGLGILGWGVGGLEATSILLGKPSRWTMPELVGVHLTGELQATVSATDVALSLTAMLRQNNVVGCFMEFFGPGVEHLSAQDRCTIANMAPEYGTKSALFPMDERTLEYLRLTGRKESDLQRIQTFYAEQGLWNGEGSAEKSVSTANLYNRVISFDLSTVQITLAGPNYPHLLVDSAQTFTSSPVKSEPMLPENSILIAAITSCTNTSNARLIMTAALLAKKAVEQGLNVPWYVKTSLAPGSLAVTSYLKKAGLLPYLEALGFFVVGYGCTTCNGGGGDLKPEVLEVLKQQEQPITTSSVLSGNRNFSGRIHPKIENNYLASPAMVIAYALAGTIEIDFSETPLGHNAQGRAIYLQDLYPTDSEVHAMETQFVDHESFKFPLGAPPQWSDIAFPEQETFQWHSQSTYLQSTPYKVEKNQLSEFQNCRPLLILEDNVTTDDISPVGKITPESQAGQYLKTLDVPEHEFNTFGARRGNYHVMVRGAYSNPSLKNAMALDQETAFDRAHHYQETGTIPFVIAGKNYGFGSSRDWAAKAPALLGVKMVLAESFERIHRYNLLSMSILPLQFVEGESWKFHGLTGQENYTITPVGENSEMDGEFQVNGKALISYDAPESEEKKSFLVNVMINGEDEMEIVRSGGTISQLIQRYH